MIRSASLRPLLLASGVAGLLAVAAPAFAQTGDLTAAPRATAKGGAVVETLPAARAKARTGSPHAAAAQASPAPPRAAPAPTPRPAEFTAPLEVDVIKA